VSLSPTQRFLAGATLAILVVTVLLGLQYFDNVGRKDDLNRRLAALQATVDRINAATAAGENGVPLLTTPAFPQNPPNLDLASVILASASASGVSTGTLDATTQGTEKVGANTYRTVATTVTINGTLPRLLDFFDRVERGGVHTLVFDNMHADATEGRWTIQVQLIAYAQPG
jgi:hypothetical protein